MGSQGLGKITDNGEEKMKKKFFLLVTSYWLLVTIAGCGYTSRSMFATKFRSIYIPQFVNKIDITTETDTLSKYKIYRPMLETDVSKAVINKYLFDGNLKPVQKESADLVLKGELIEFRKDPLRYTEGTDDVEEYRINIVVNLSLWDNRENKLLWEEKNFTGETTYFTITTNPQYKSEGTAITAAINDLARRIVERTVEEW